MRAFAFPALAIMSLIGVETRLVWLDAPSVWDVFRPSCYETERTEPFRFAKNIDIIGSSPNENALSPLPYLDDLILVRKRALPIKDSVSTWSNSGNTELCAKVAPLKFRGVINIGYVNGDPSDVRVGRSLPEVLKCYFGMKGRPISLRNIINDDSIGCENICSQLSLRRPILIASDPAKEGSYNREQERGDSGNCRINLCNEGSGAVSINSDDIDDIGDAFLKMLAIMIVLVICFVYAGWKIP
jgi:hypothetical protein